MPWSGCECRDRTPRRPGMNGSPVVGWTRLEPLTRASSLAAAVQARTADPLWMLTRQWQFAAFAGEDAGSPAWVRLEARASRLTRFLPGMPDGTPGLALDVGRVPLETLVETERLPTASPPAFAA